MQLDIVMLSPIQMHSLLADAIYDSNGLISLDAWVPGAARLCMKMFDPQLEAKRLTVGKMAKVTPLQALTGPEKERLSSMAASVFATYDNDNSGKLDRDEFMRCLTESKLGLTERQISHMMAAADVSEDGLIDYSEFADLFNNCILELARLDAVDKMLYAEDAAATVEKGVTLLLDVLQRSAMKAQKYLLAVHLDEHRFAEQGAQPGQMRPFRQGLAHLRRHLNLVGALAPFVAHQNHVYSA